jgi:hypothetical protein
LPSFSVSLSHHLIFNDAFGLYWVLSGFNSDISLPRERRFEGVKVTKIDIPMGSEGDERVKAEIGKYEKGKLKKKEEE